MAFSFAKLGSKQLAMASSVPARINVAEGAVRSGKTIGQLVQWQIYATKYVKRNQPLMMIGNTQDSLKRNDIDPLIDMFGDREVKYKEGELKFFGRTIYCFGAKDKGAEASIRGATVAGCYIGEVTTIPKVVVDQSLARCSLGYGASFWNTNPDSPFHETFEQYIDNQKLVDGGELKRWRFGIQDNPGLSIEYKRFLYRSLSGVFRRRNFFGEWCVAEGQVYDGWDAEANTFTTGGQPSRFDFYDLAVDYGTQNAFVLQLWAWKGSTAFLLDEWYYSGRKEGQQMDDEQYVIEIFKFLDKNKLPLSQVEKLFHDPAAAHFALTAFRKQLPCEIADNDVRNGIACMSSMINIRTMKVNKDKCKNFLKEVKNYAWDDKATKGKEEPIKKDDHCMDTARYEVYTRKLYVTPGIYGIAA